MPGASATTRRRPRRRNAGTEPSRGAPNMYFADPEMQLMYKVANAPIADFPYPHILVHDVFPGDFYQELRRHLPPAAAFKSLKALGRVTGDYPESRGVLLLVPDQVNQLDEPYRAFWSRTAEWLIG